MESGLSDRKFVWQETDGASTLLPAADPFGLGPPQQSCRLVFGGRGATTTNHQPLEAMKLSNMTEPLWRAIQVKFISYQVFGL